MNRKSLFVPVCIAGAAAAVVIGSLAIAQPTKDAKLPTKDLKVPTQPGQPEMQLPPGWTTEDMKACELASTPGEMHAFLAKEAGTWQGKCTMWMFPDAPPMPSDCTETVTVIMDGRFLKSEMAGDMMGAPFNGLSTIGFDNVSRKFVSNWIDNQTTGMWNGTGELSADQKTLTWTFTFNCPVTKKAQTAREVVKYNSPTSKTMEMFTKEPKSGKEYKMLSIEFTKK